MADKKISQLTSLTTPASVDLLYIIDDPNGTPQSKKITLKDFFGAVPANTVFNSRTRMNGNTTIACSNTVVTSNVNMTGTSLFRANNVILTMRNTPGSNNALAQGYRTGQVFFTNTHIYVAVNATTLKRAALSTF